LSSFERNLQHPSSEEEEKNETKFYFFEEKNKTAGKNYSLRRKLLKIILSSFLFSAAKL